MSSRTNDEDEPRPLMSRNSLLLAQMQQSLAIHSEMFDRLIDRDDDLSLHLAELFEDVANRYLDISEAISASVRSRRGGRDAKLKRG